MHTLHDFMVLTKGQEYLIAVAAMVLFAVFWHLLDHKKKANESVKKTDKFE